MWLQIRESIKALFPNRTCFPLVRPMSDESQLQRLEAVPPSQLRPEFQQVRTHFCRFPCSNYKRSAPEMPVMLQQLPSHAAMP